MSLSSIGRKHLLEHGKQRKIAKRLDVSDAFISSVMQGTDFPSTRAGWVTYRKAQRAIARALNMSVGEAFSEYERGLVVLEEMAS